MKRLAQTVAVTKLEPDKAGHEAKPPTGQLSRQAMSIRPAVWAHPDYRKNVSQHFEATIMKKLATLAFAVLATSAFAAPGNGNGGGGGGHHGGSNTPSITISGKSVQSASLIFTAVRNKAENGGVAVQNVASNAGNVTISGGSNQSVTGLLADVSNLASGKSAYASQNLASNLGDVTVRGSSTQSVGMFGAYVANRANAGSTAVQNVASNNACVSCNE